MYDVVIHNVIILSAHNRYQPFVGSVTVRGVRIVEVIEGNLPDVEAKTWIDGKGKILMPGLVNGHCHGDMTLARGLGDGMTLLEQDTKYMSHRWFYDFITDEDRFYSRQLTYCEALLSGTTFINENMYWGLGDLSVKAMADIGIRGALAEDIRPDFTDASVLRTAEELTAFRQLCEKHGLIPSIGGISEETYEPELLTRIESIRQKADIMETCHLAETTWRLAIIAEKYNTTPVKMLYDLGLLGKFKLGSHVVHLTEEEIGYLADTGTSVVNTPLCEMKITDGIAPIPAMVKRGVNVCLGTDGAMWSNSNDIFREMRAMSLIHSMNSGIRTFTNQDIIDMATINGAKAYGIEDSYGTIEAGKKADFILIDTNKPHLTPILLGEYENVTSHVVFNVNGQDVTDVFVNGIHKVKDGKLVGVDVEFIQKKVQETSDKIVRCLSTQ